MLGGEARRLPRTDNRRHPLRLSLGGSRSRVARFRFAGRGEGTAAMGSRSRRAGGSRGNRLRPVTEQRLGSEY